jgi:twinkle protein
MSKGDFHAEEDSDFLHHEPCPACGSRDNLARYSDGHGWCFGCNHREPAHLDDTPPRVTPIPHRNSTTTFQPVGEFVALRKRKVSEVTCQKFDYRVFENEQHAVYHSPETGRPVAAKVRRADKSFSWLGSPKQAGLYGQHLWNGGRKLVLTEGELDCLSVAEVQGQGKWPVCSVPNGAAGAKRDCARQLEFLEKFDEVVIMFDQDDFGIHAANEVAGLLTPGKAKIATLTMKDASELLMSGRPGDITTAMWQARTVRPDGIVAASELWDSVIEIEEHATTSYPWKFLDDKLYGLRRSEIVTVTSGSGMGKSALVRELAYHLLVEGHTIGGIFLEETVKRTILGLMGIHAELPLHLPDGRDQADDELMRAAFDATAGTERLFLFDHFGSSDPAVLYAKIKYLVKGCGASVIILDHISMVVSGIGEGDERRLIDNVMTQLRVLAQQLDVVFIVVSHLRRPQGQGHEDGAQTSLSQLRGSAAIAQLSDQVIGLERDQQDEDHPDVTTVRILKNRFSGETGIAGYLAYSRDTGRLQVTDKPLKGEPTKGGSFENAF